MLGLGTRPGTSLQALKSRIKEARGAFDEGKSVVVKFWLTDPTAKPENKNKVKACYMKLDEYDEQYFD